MPECPTPEGSPVQWLDGVVAAARRLRDTYRDSEAACTSGALQVVQAINDYDHGIAAMVVQLGRRRGTDD